MHLAYSAISNTDDNALSIDIHVDRSETDLSLRYKAYQSVCEKYRKEIAAIQNYIPGWIPEFTY